MELKFKAIDSAGTDKSETKRPFCNREQVYGDWMGVIEAHCPHCMYPLLIRKSRVSCRRCGALLLKADLERTIQRREAEQKRTLELELERKEQLEVLRRQQEESERLERERISQECKRTRRKKRKEIVFGCMCALTSLMIATLYSAGKIKEQGFFALILGLVWLVTRQFTKMYIRRGASWCFSEAKRAWQAEMYIPAFLGCTIGCCLMILGFTWAGMHHSEDADSHNTNNETGSKSMQANQLH